MWAITTESGDVITEEDCSWVDLPVGVHVVELVYGHVRLSEFSEYGFQRYSMTVPGQHVPAAGVQLIGVYDGMAKVIDIEEATGRVESSEIPRSSLTYRAGLLRHGG